MKIDRGIAAALIAAVLFGLSTPIAKILIGGMSPLLLAGLLSLSPRYQGGNLMGPLAIGAACLAWAIDNNLTRKVSIHYGAVIPNSMRLIQAGFVGFVGYGLSLTLFVVALRNLGTARTGTYFSLAPFIGAALAIVLGAPLTGVLLAAAALMGVGIWLHLSENHAHPHFHDSMVHEHVHTHDEHHRHAHEPGWDGKEPHSHVHVHEPLTHAHAHYPDVHHRHEH
jgi:drug/metabolite transporter (DMT)-like permease